MFYNTGISKNYRVARNVPIYKSIWSNQYIITNCYISNNCRINANPYTIAEFRRSFSLAPILLANGNAFMNVTVASDNNININRDAIGMPYI